MTTALAPAPEAIADVLSKAADHLDRVGWHQGYLYDEEQADSGMPLDDCRVCTVGAIYTAIYGLPRHGLEGADLLLAHTAEDAIESHLDLGAASGVTTIADWNDDAKTTAEQVTTALRATAASLRGEA